jgi:O-acetylhomoserine (thiol)-lyase
MSPQVAFQLLQGLETRPLRMARHVENAEAVARYLAAHPMVECVRYPGLASHPDYALAQQLLPRGAGAVISFDIKGSREQGRQFVEALTLFSHLANVGDAKSLVIHPASTTHFRMSEADLAASGIGAATVRLSVGLEACGDLLEDLARGLKAAEKSLAKTAGAGARADTGPASRANTASGTSHGV